MKNIIKTTLIVFAFGTTFAFANGNTTNANKITMNEVLPSTVIAFEKPALPKHKKVRPVQYSPEQKASIVELALNSK